MGICVAAELAGGGEGRVNLGGFEKRPPSLPIASLAVIVEVAWEG